MAAGRSPGGRAVAPSGLGHQADFEEFTACGRGVRAVPDRKTGLDARGRATRASPWPGDAGEVVECLRRLAREGDPLRERLAGELGDVWRYWTRLCAASGVCRARS